MGWVFNHTPNVLVNSHSKDCSVLNSDLQKSKFHISGNLLCIYLNIHIIVRYLNHSIVPWFILLPAGGRTYCVRDVAKGRDFCFVLNSPRFLLRKQAHC